jgi:predicted transcriptional regulator
MFWISAYQVLTQSRGALARILILQKIANSPMNANKLASSLGLDYKTVKHHLRVLEEVNFISSLKNCYGSAYHLTEYFHSHAFVIKTNWIAPREQALAIAPKQDPMSMSMVYSARPDKTGPGRTELARNDLLTSSGIPG